MLSTQHITQAQLEALFDEELPFEEHDALFSHIKGCEVCSAHYLRHDEEQQLLQQALQHTIQAATASVDWDAFGAQLQAELALVPTPERACIDEPAEMAIAPAIEMPERQNAIQAPSTPGLPWWREMVEWVRLHPSFWLAAAATAAVVLMLSLPWLDPGPQPKADVLVERIVKSKNAKVSVLRRKGRMTLIVVQEPPSEAGSSNDTDGTARKQPKGERQP